MKTYNFFTKYYDEIIRGSDYDLDMEVDLIDEMILKFGNGGKYILEFACGTGVVANKLKSKGFNVTGVDLSESMLEKAANNIGNKNIILGDMKSVDLGKQYDVVLCNYNSICHLTSLKDWQEFIKNAYKHLKEGGIFVFDIITLFEFENIARDYKGFFNIDDDTICLEMFKEKQIFTWFIKMFIKNDSGTYDLVEEEIKEKSFEMNKIKKELENLNFKLLHLEDFHDGEVSTGSERVYFVAKK